MSIPPPDEPCRYFNPRAIECRLGLQVPKDCNGCSAYEWAGARADEHWRRVWARTVGYYAAMRGRHPSSGQVFDAAGKGGTG